jgi:hypothetical protein
VKDSTIIGEFGTFIWQNNKYLEKWKACFEELPTADVMYRTQGTEREKKQVQPN